MPSARLELRVQYFVHSKEEHASRLAAPMCAVPA
jgi:hypothetical protein